MTAEVAILNRSAVALAADSTVTLDGPEGHRKTYNTVNKLFTLSKHHPVGAMIYGDASLMDVPWESLIKEYRRLLVDKSFPTIKEYADDVVRFLESRNDIFTAEQQRVHFATAAIMICTFIQKEIHGKVKIRSEKGESITDKSVALVVSETLADWQKSCEDDDILPHRGAGFDRQLAKEYAKEIDEARTHVLGKFPLLDADIANLKGIIAKIVAIGWGPTTGLVIAGFGENEIFPAVRTLQVHGIALGKLIFGEDIKNECHQISYDSGAALLPFAQKDVVNAFLTGCEYSYATMIMQMFRTVMENLPRITIAHMAKVIGQLDETHREAVESAMNSDISKIKEDFFETFHGYQNEKHIKPLLDVIAALPKDELASMAEALVNLTSVKRKMSLDQETVGGAIDVALISKGDGFIWIRRKHYFSPELNPHFMGNYFRR